MEHERIVRREGDVEAGLVRGRVRARVRVRVRVRGRVRIGARVRVGARARVISQKASGSAKGGPLTLLACGEELVEGTR